MSKMKLRLITIVSLALLFVFTLGMALGALPVVRTSVGAATYSPTTIFSAGTDGEVGASEAADGETSWVQFTLKDGGKAHFRRDLALKWFEEDKDAEDSPLAKPGKPVYFSMSFALPELNFDKLTLTFESNEENISKDGVATNKLIVTKGTDMLKVSVQNATYEGKEEDLPATEIAYTAGQDFVLAFGEAEEAGAFALTVTVGSESKAVGNFTNIGGYYAEYRTSSASQPATPITFEAKLASGATSQKILMKSLNGQTFEVGENGNVTDNAEPVLVVNEAIYPYRLGQKFSLSYKALDVCRTSVSSSNKQYYMLKKDKDGDKETWHMPSETANSADYKSLSTSTCFMPTGETDIDEAYVSMRFDLDDGTFNDYFVYLTWYAADGAVATLGDEDYTAGYKCSVCGHTCDLEEYKKLSEADPFKCPGKVENEDGESVDCTAALSDYKAQGNYYDYIKVLSADAIRKEQEENNKVEWPTYLNLKADKETGTNTKYPDAEAADQVFADYQNQLDAVATKASAGDGSYLYLPSMRTLIGSDYADYRNLTFSIYYYRAGTAAGDSASSTTSLKYNNLRLEVKERGEYRFRVLAQDTSSNVMKYYDEDKELVTVSSSNIWDIEGIPEFTFYIDYSGPTVEEMDIQTDGYRDRTYTISSFKVVALSGYKTEYELYHFELDDDHKSLAYKDLVEDIKGLEEDELPDWIKNNLKLINKYNSDVKEDDAEWERTDNAYAWNPDSSLSFCPQEPGYYVVKLTVTDARLVGLSTTAYQVINIGNPMDTISGRSKWLENNLTAIILFSISAVLLVAIIVLFVVKPSDKTVEEVDLESLKGKKKQKVEKPEKNEKE